MKKALDIHWLIIIFAFLHVLATWLCIRAGIDRTYFLTIISLAMASIICIRERLSLNVTAICIILTNILGIILGKEIGNILSAVGMASPWRGMASTMLTTCIIGYGLVLFAEKIPKGTTDYDSLKEKHMAYLTAAAFAILLARIFFESYLIHNFLQDHNIRETISVFLSHPMTLMTMTVITIAFIKSCRNGRLQHNIIKHLILLLICGPAMAGLMMKFIANEGKCIGLTDNFIGMTTVAVIIEIAVYSLVFLINYLFEARRDAMEEKIKANQAKAQYISLKRQVSPHFLFNNLNILDCMVAEEKNTDARTFISHLTELYRHMLKYENDSLITLKEEMSYVANYMELLKVRFPKGLEITYDIPEKDMQRFVVTYSVQLLVENAVKHNATPAKNPLIINVSSDSCFITIRNNLIPRLSPLESTGHGLEYVRQSYLDNCEKKIHIEKNDSHYSVSIPLL